MEQHTLLQSSYLRGHRWLRAVIDGGQVADPGFPLGFDGGQQSGLSRGQWHLDALRG